MAILGRLIALIAGSVLRKEWETLRASVAQLHRAHLSDPQGAPPWNAQALLISGEDHRFFDHHGVDFVAVCRVIWRRAVSNRIEGASTIEMQLVRVLTGRFERSFRRKLTEIGLATLLSSALPKGDIPAMYLRVGYYGAGMANFTAACRRLNFRTDGLTMRQAASLVARLKYPEPLSAPIPRRRQLNHRSRHLLRLYDHHVQCRYYRGLLTSGIKHAAV